MAWISAQEALRQLGVRPQTLYAYVSRGRIAARPDPSDPRRSLYDAGQVARLAARRTGPRRESEIAAETMAWGEPILASALTTVANGRLVYRGHDAVALSRHATLEEAASLFWDAPFADATSSSAPRGGTIKARLFATLSARAAADPYARNRARALLAADSSAILAAMADAVCGASAPGPIHARLARAWGLKRADADVLRRVLVLLLDHELNASTFAARVAASTGASLAAAALAGLSTLSGPLHGAAVEAVMRFIADARGDPRRAVRARLDEDRPLPGFGHPLYPDGDPRAQALLSAMSESAPIAALRRAAKAERGEAPNIDFAVAAFAVQSKLTAEQAFATFAIGRAVGWLGHAMEQIETGALIRPRARYIGPRPIEDEGDGGDATRVRNDR